MGLQDKIPAAAEGYSSGADFESSDVYFKYDGKIGSAYKYLVSYDDVVFGEFYKNSEGKYELILTIDGSNHEDDDAIDGFDELYYDETYGPKYFQIDVNYELNFISRMVTSGINFSGRTIKITKNITETRFMPIGCKSTGTNYNNDYYFELIESSGNAFDGHFDGMGHTLKLTTTTWEIGGEPAMIGMISKTNYATIQNLKLEWDLIVEKYDNWYVGELFGGEDCLAIGSLVGYAVNTLINNCLIEKFNYYMPGECYLDRDYTSYIGGVVGYAEDNNSGDYRDSYIANCLVRNFSIKIIQHGVTYAELIDYPVQYANICISGIGAVYGNLTVHYVVVDNGDLSERTVGRNVLSAFENWDFDFDDYGSRIDMSDKYKIYNEVCNVGSATIDDTTLCCTAIDDEFYTINPFSAKYWYAPPAVSQNGFGNGVPYYLKSFIYGGFKNYNFLASSNGEVAITVTEKGPDGKSQTNKHANQFKNSGYKNAFRLARLSASNANTYPTVKTNVDTNSKVIIDGLTIEAKPNAGYRFIGWKYQLKKDSIIIDSKTVEFEFETYTAQFEKETYYLNIEIYGEDGNALIQTINKQEIQMNNEIQVKYGNSTIIISGLKGSSVSAAIDKMYTLDYATFENTENLKVGDYTQGETKTLRIYLKLKSYGVEVG